MVNNQEANRFTYADLYSDCYRYLGISDPKTIRKMTLTEYKALRRGSTLKYIDDLELLYTQAYYTALSGGFDKDGKPIIKSFKDLFDRKKIEQELLRDSEDEKHTVDPEKVAAFKRSKEYAEALMNGISVGEEELNGDKV